MFRKLIALAITSGLAAQALRLWIDRDQTRQRAKTAPAAPPTEVQRWEDEGGNPAPAQPRPV